MHILIFSVVFFVFSRPSSGWGMWCFFALYFFRIFGIQGSCVFFTRSVGSQVTLPSKTLLDTLETLQPSEAPTGIESAGRIHRVIRRVPPCAAKTCALRPVFARVVGELRAADESNFQGPIKQKC